MTVEILNKLKIYADAFNQIRDVLNERERRIFLAETAARFHKCPQPTHGNGDLHDTPGN